MRPRPTLQLTLLPPAAEPAALNAGALPVLPAATGPCADRVIIVRGVEHNGTLTRGGWAYAKCYYQENFFSCSTI